MGLKENLQNDPVRRLNLRQPVVVGEAVLVADAIEEMRAAELGCTIVADDGGKPVGMFTEGMLREKLAADPSVVQQPMAEHMARKFPWVTLDDPIALVLDAMQANNTRFICVVDAEGKVSGLTGQKGLMEYIAEHFPRQVMVQRIDTNAYGAQREGA